MQLRDPEAVGALHHHDGGLRDVDADLNDRGGDQDIELARAEAVHHLLADGGRHLAVHEPDAQPRQLAGRQPLVLLAGRLGLDPQRVADQRAHHEGAVPGRHLGAHPVPGLRLAAGRVAGQPLGRDGLAARRELVERGEIEVAEDHHGRRARDGRRRHDQEVRVAVAALGPQRGPLLDAEAVLLVDHHRTERAERDLLGQQGVRPHHHAHRARGQALEHRGARLALDPAGEQLDAHLAAPHAPGPLQVAEEGAHGREVLFRQHLGGDHEGTLVPALHGRQQRGQRHHRLARADVALQEPVHREGPGHVRHNDGQGAALGLGQLVGQAGQEARHERVAHAAGDLAGRHGVVQGAGVDLEGPPAQHQRQLQAEELVEHQAAAGGRDHGERLRPVDGPEGVGAVPQVDGVPPLLGERVGELAGALERFCHELPDLPRRQPGLGRRRVDGQDPQRLAARRHAGDHVDHGVGQLAGAPVLGDLAEEDGLRAGLELLGPPGLVEEDDLQPAGVVAHRDVDDGSPGAGAPGMCRLHGGEHGRLVSDLQVRDVGLAGAVDVAPGVRRDEVEDGLHAEIDQPPGLALGHRLEHGDVPLAQVAECAAVTQSPAGTGRGAGRPGAPRPPRRGTPR